MASKKDMPSSIKAIKPTLFDEEVWAKTQLERIEKALDQIIEKHTFGQLVPAMRYAVLGQGKRLRPLLVLASAQAVGSLESQAALHAACAVELIHAYSLVHDDMPCMDNDALRRGQPTVHVKYGQGIAMLVGDALQALAFEVLTPKDENGVSFTIQAQMAGLLSRAAGTAGMAGGQAIDLLSVGSALNESQLQKMHQYKTGALLSACVSMGIASQSRLVAEEAQKYLMLYAHHLGLAFQIVDDILDETAPSEVIGKTAGKDAHADKPTYVTILGLEVAKQRAQELYEKAILALEQSQLEDIEPLRALANQIVVRSY